MDQGMLWISCIPIHVEMPITMLLQSNPALWYDLCDWMNVQLNSMARVPNEPLEPHELSMQGSQEAREIPINKLGQYIESDNTNI